MRKADVRGKALFSFYGRTVGVSNSDAIREQRGQEETLKRKTATSSISYRWPLVLENPGKSGKVRECNLVLGKKSPEKVENQTNVMEKSLNLLEKNWVATLL